MSKKKTPKKKSIKKTEKEPASPPAQKLNTNAIPVVVNSDSVVIVAVDKPSN